MTRKLARIWLATHRRTAAVVGGAVDGGVVGAAVVGGAVVVAAGAVVTSVVDAVVVDPDPWWLPQPARRAARAAAAIGASVAGPGDRRRMTSVRPGDRRRVTSVRVGDV